MEGESGYRPISCDFHDDMEAYAVTRRRVRIELASPDPAQDGGPGGIRHEGLIQDIYTTEKKEEFLRLEDGTEIRLDRIKAITPLA
ncbi:MAG: uncharacterized protein JWP91_3749 [Fibrobacteres bacterium]|nr:uncharacterized protein [Fibrobacterota bacterium]